MRNLSKVNKKNPKKKMSRRLEKSLIAGACSVFLLSGIAAVPVMAEAVDPVEAISIEKPSGWKQGSTDIHITVDGSHLGEGVSISKVEAKVGEGSWQDVTAGMAVTISTNTTVYVRITDSEGNIYEQNRSIRCYDTEKPTLSASLTDGVLTIQGQDTFSGISGITVNGTEYKELKDGVLKIQLTQKDFTTKKIEITVTDGAGNTSDTYSLQNPYYEWAVKQAIAQQADTSGDLSTTTGTGTTQETEVTAPLPQSATPSEPTESRGTVEDRTITGIEQELAQKNETVDTISSTTTAGGKEFYTISTKSGKVFYLIIDNDSSQDNVYFLTEVDNEDLMNFTLSDTVTLPAVDTVYATLEDKPEPTLVTEVTPEPETEEPETEVQMPEEQSKVPGYVLLGILCTGVLAGAYYFKIYRPKQDNFDDEEYEEDLAQKEEKEEPEYLDDEDDTGLNSPGYFLDDEED